MTYIKKVAIGFDQFINTLLGGWPDETFSARAWRNSQVSFLWTVVRLLVDGLALLFLDKNHCQKSFMSEHFRSQLPEEYR